MDFVEPEYNTAVAAMRLQTPFLHGGHLKILTELVENHEKVIVMLGITPILGSTENPLTFEQRRHMLAETFPSVIVLKDEAVQSDEVWSKRFDKEVKSILTPNDTVCFYGGRDSAIPSYSGKFPTREFADNGQISSTELRRIAGRGSVNSEDFRRGVIWATQNGFDNPLPTVDIAILNEDETQILLGRKEHQTKFRLIGGFADNEASYEADARREVQEETGLSITDPEYIGSAIIPDWRYAREKRNIKTLLFKARVMFGTARADDDIAEVKWHKLANIEIKRDIEPTHHELMTMVLASVQQEN